MKTVTAIAILLVVSAEGFAPHTTYGVRAVSSVALSTATPEIKKEIDRKFIRKQIDQLTADNFDAKLKEIEPFLVSVAGATFYTKCQRRIATRAKLFGKAVPSEFAKEAMATAKRREKQAAFIQTKIEEAEASAAEAAAVEGGLDEAASEEEAVPAEE